MFRLFGYGNAISFKDLTDHEMAIIENNVRIELLNRIKSSSYTAAKNIEDNMLEHFGRFYLSRPDDFEFLPGDKSSIKKLVKHVNDMIVQKRYNYFEENSIDEEDDDRKLKTNEKNPSYVQVLLNHLLAAAKKNLNRSRQGYRYSNEIRKYATYLRMIMGHLAYQTLHGNLRGTLPSIQSVNRYVHKTYAYISEGILRTNELYLYLTERKLPLLVSLSEDATRIVGRPKYDRKSN